jgi:hypothetical protein
MLIMIAETSTSRRVYWAHSKDGISWTGVRKPLVSADLDYKKIPGTDIKPNYEGSMGNNVAASFFMESNGRYFVFFNGSSGNICVAEVGEALDMEIHWGEYMKAADVIIDKDDNGNLIALPRVASPLFVTDDMGKRYMFFEAGSRLGANIAYAKEQEVTTSATLPSMNHSTVSLYPTLLRKGQQITIQTKDSKILCVEVFDILGKKVQSFNFKNETCKLAIPYSKGLYVLKTTLEDNSVFEAKIIVTN